MIERAYAVLNAREEIKQRFVKERYQEQWRESCDDIRVQDSKAMTLQISKVRLKQICEKDAIKVQLSMDDDVIQDEWTKQTELSHEIRVEKEIRKQQYDLVAAIGLNNQVQLCDELDDDQSAPVRVPTLNQPNAFVPFEIL
jgi:DNA repair exonuclease SbcCD nuclease subunit